MTLAHGARWIVASIAIGAFASGCSGETRIAKPVTVSSTPATTRGLVDATQQAVLIGYKGMWAYYGRDLTSHNWQHPSVTAYATGQALLLLEANILEDNHDGVVTRGAPALYPVAKLGAGPKPSTAEVIDCADFADVWKYSEATNRRKEDRPDGWHLIDASLVLKGGQWKVSDLATGATGSC